MVGQLVQADITGVTQQNDRWKVTTSAESFEAEQVVMALGPWAGQWMKPLGYHFPTFVKRGYHMHYDAAQGTTLNYALMDSEKGYLLTPKKAGLRLTTGAELNTIDAPPRLGQLEAAEREARDFFALGARREATPWKGARPCLADMKPVIGPAHAHDGLWFAFGHGHQGFTLGPATGRLIGQMMDGEAPMVDMQPFRSDRFY